MSTRYLKNTPLPKASMFSFENLLALKGGLLGVSQVSIYFQMSLLEK
jgi:hypothetical protein